MKRQDERARARPPDARARAPGRRAARALALPAATSGARGTALERPTMATAPRSFTTGKRAPPTSHRELGQIARRATRRSSARSGARRARRACRGRGCPGRRSRRAGSIPRSSLETLARELELGLEGEVGQVARDDDVVDLRARDLARDGPHVRGAVDVTSLQAQVDPSGESLVEEAPRGHALERRGDGGPRNGRSSWALVLPLRFHRASPTQRKPTHAGRGNDVVSRAADRTHTAPSSYEPPRMT